MSYRGRFAPTPSGPLHFGSLVSATASFLEAKTNQGLWFLRIDDLDPPRVAPNSITTILFQLEAFGFEWDEEVVYQSHRFDLYQDSLDKLLQNSQAYFCNCSRQEIFARNPAGIYQGFCRERNLSADSSACSIRFKTPNQQICLPDKIQGEVCIDGFNQLGDFVLKRRDGLFGYQLASAVDDLAMEITDLVRGFDLINSSLAQSLLRKALNPLAKPILHAHHPLVVNHEQVKFSKSANSAAIDATRSGCELWQALEFLNQAPPADLNCAKPREIWAWAIDNWQLTQVPTLAGNYKQNLER